MDPPRSQTVSVVVDNSISETTRGERQIRFQLFETKHEMSIEAIREDLRAAYRALPEEQRPDPELDLTNTFDWEWKHEDKLKQRFFDRLSCLGINVSV